MESHGTLEIADLQQLAALGSNVILVLPTAIKLSGVPISSSVLLTANEERCALAIAEVLRMLHGAHPATFPKGESVSPGHRIPTPVELLEATLSSLENGEFPEHERAEELEIAGQQLNAAIASYKERLAFGWTVSESEAKQIFSLWCRLSRLQQSAQ